MATKVIGRRATDNAVSDDVARRWNDSPPVVWLARLGAVFALLEIYIFARWILSDAFVATPPGSDHDPNLFWIRFWEVVAIVGSVLFVAWVVRKTVRDKQFPTVGIVALAWTLTAWQDPGVDALRPVFAYNSHFFNRGTWAEFIPGWSTASGSNPQPIWFWVATYLLFVPLATMVTATFLRWVSRVLPRINRAGLVVAGFTLMLVADVVVEQVWLRQGLYQYFRVNHNLSLWTGLATQFPLFEGFAWGGGMMGLSAVLYYFRDRRGRMITDAGLDRVRTRKGHIVIRVLALGAAFNIAMIVFNLGFNYANQHADTAPPNVPSYFSNGFCGVEPNPPCPAPR